MAGRESGNESPFAEPARSALEAAKNEAIQAAGGMITENSVVLETADDWAYAGWEDDGGQVIPEA